MAVIGDAFMKIMEEVLMEHVRAIKRSAMPYQNLILRPDWTEVYGRPAPLMAGVTDRGLVNVEIVKKGDGSPGGHLASDVQIRTTRGETVWVPETDVIARKPNPEEKA